MEIAKIGDRIEWVLKARSLSKYDKDKTFQADIKMVDNEQNVYGVYIDYLDDGNDWQDLIPFDQCKVVAKRRKCDCFMEIGTCFCED